MPTRSSPSTAEGGQRAAGVARRGPVQARPASAGPSGIGRRLRTAVTPWAMLAPAMVVLAAFTYLPMITALTDSLHNPAGRPTLGNYRHLAADPVFWTAVRNNVAFALVTVPASVGLALLFALWVNRSGRALLRLLFFTPALLPPVAVGSIWLFLYTPGYGPIDRLGTLLGLPTHNLLGDPHTALPALMVVTVWNQAALFMIFFLAALQAIPPELAEASRLAGASGWYHFRRVTLPLLGPTLLFVGVVALTNAFKQVDVLFVTTQGGPDNASTLILFYLYQVGFAFLQQNYAAVLTVVLIVVLLVASLVQIRLLDRRVHYR